MSLLTDTDLAKMIVQDRTTATPASIIITPYSVDCLTPVGYDLRVGSPVAISNETGLKELVEGDDFSIAPGSTALISTLEVIHMPSNKTVSALIKSKVTKVSKGLSHISTTVDPDWEGKLLIAVHNHSPEKFVFRYGDSFCTMVFLQNSSPSTKPCDKSPGRLDVFLAKFVSESKAAAKRKAMRDYAPPLIVLLLSGGGYLAFGNAPGFAATVAIAVAISQFVGSKIR